METLKKVGITLGVVVLGVALLKLASPMTAKIPVVGKYLAI